MALDSSFAAAYIDNGGGHRILGRRLRPFSLWHALLLQTIHSPFMAGGNATLFDLKNAVAICRMRYRQSHIRRQILPRFLTRSSLEKQVERFLTYIGDYLSRPEYSIIPWDNDKPTKPSKHLTHPPGVICVAYNAARGARISIMEAWDMPIGEAYISEAMHLREQGTQLDFLDDEEKRFQEEMKEAGIA